MKTNPTFRALALLSTLTFSASAVDQNQAPERGAAKTDAEVQSAEAISTATIRGSVADLQHVTSGTAGEESNAAKRHHLIKVRMQDGREVLIAVSGKTMGGPLPEIRGELEAVGKAAIVEGVPVLLADRVTINGQPLSPAAASPESDPLDAGTTPSPGKARAEITDEARELLDKVRDAFQNVKSLELNGTYESEVALESVETQSKVSFQSSFRAPHHFTHESAGIRISGDGRRIVVHDPQAKTAIEAPLEANRPLHEALPPSAVTALHTHNPVLLGAMIPGALEKLFAAAKRVERLDDGMIDGTRHPQLVIRGIPNHGPISVMVDPKTLLPRRVSIDLRDLVDDATPDERARRARVVIDYTTINLDSKEESTAVSSNQPASTQDRTGTPAPAANPSTDAQAASPRPAEGNDNRPQVTPPSDAPAEETSPRETPEQ